MYWAQLTTWWTGSTSTPSARPPSCFGQYRGGCSLNAFDELAVRLDLSLLDGVNQYVAHVTVGGRRLLLTLVHFKLRLAGTQECRFDLLPIRPRFGSDLVWPRIYVVPQFRGGKLSESGPATRRRRATLQGR